MRGPVSWDSKNKVYSLKKISELQAMVPVKYNIKCLLVGGEETVQIKQHTMNRCDMYFLA